MTVTNNRSSGKNMLSRREFFGLTLATGAGALLSACASQATCRVDLVGLAGEHDAAACPHRFCSYHPHYDAVHLSPTTERSAGTCLFHSHRNPESS